MEDIGDIIYLLFIAIAAIGSIFSKSKKQKKAAAEAEKQKKSVFEELEQSWEEFEESFGKSQAEPIPAETYKPYVSPFETVAAPAEPMKYETPAHEPLSYDNAEDFSELRVKKRMKESVFKKQSTLRVVDLDDDTDESGRTINISLDKPEDARMAFIYSEIFNRKYS